MKGLVGGLLVLIALFIAGFLALGEFVYDYSFSVHRFPIIVGLATIALAAIAFVRTLVRPAPQGDEEEAASAWPSGTTAALLWLAAALPIVVFLGYLVGPALYLFIYLKLHGEKWLTAAVFAIGALLVIYFGFHELLAVRVPIYPFWWPE